MIVRQIRPLACCSAPGIINSTTTRYEDISSSSRPRWDKGTKRKQTADSVEGTTRDDKGRVRRDIFHGTVL